jgi:hypothetical protein
MSLLEPSKNFSTPQSPKTSSGKRPLSERRIQANRKNALRSTGPKTARGKQIVARNAVKHGFLAREVVITAGDGEENREEFHALVERLWKDYEPVGVMEESLVQTIATCLWRKARVIRAENGEIRKRLDTTRMDLSERNLDKGTLAVQLTQMDFEQASWYFTERRWAEMQSARSDLRGQQDGLNYLRTLLWCAQGQIERDCYLSQPIREKIFWAFSSWDREFARTCLFDGPPESDAEGIPSENTEHKRADGKNSDLARLIESKFKVITLLEERARERERLQGDSEARSFSLPPADETDKLLRYETHLDRQLYRALDQLERLQSQRKGENVPPPLNINLARRN